MRILLLAPRSEFPDVTPGWLLIPQMSLLILEALSGDSHHVRIVEEESEPVPWDERWDLVGITTMTATAPRAYELADRFRSLGAKVVLGGVHASVLPQEACEHADCVVVGEAEALWGRILDDIVADRLEKIYYSSKPRTLQVPLVRYRTEKRGITPHLAPVVGSRGCPNACEFCCVPMVYGRLVRRLPIDRLIEQVKRSEADYVAFLDDNMDADRELALELFNALKPLKVKWIGQIPVRAILDEEFFGAAVDSGLKGLFAGFETIDEKAFARFAKSVSVEDYARAVHTCRNANVFLHASFIFGMDEHDSSIFDRTLEFILSHKVPSVSTYILTPYPGTPLFERMASQGRLLHRNWKYYDHLTPVIRPARMSTEELAKGYMRFRESLFSIRGILMRMAPQIRVAPLAYLGMNRAFKRTTRILKEHYRRYFEWFDGNRP